MPSDCVQSRKTFCNSLRTKVSDSTDTVELLGITIDKNLNFTEHVSDLCKRGNQKLHALARISKCLKEDKVILIMKTFIRSQFNYCPSCVDVS